MAGPTQSATARIQPQKQTLEDAYSPPANFLEIDVTDAQTHGVGKKRYTDYEVRIRVRLCNAKKPSKIPSFLVHQCQVFSW